MHGYLSKTLPARDLVAALEAVHAGEIVVSEPPQRARSASGLDWPGRREGLTDRESEILALITQGKSNAEVAALTYLSPNTVKSYIRTIYRKIGVGSRTQAVLWGVEQRLHPRPPPHRPLARRSVERAPTGLLSEPSPRPEQTPPGCRGSAGPRCPGRPDPAWWQPAACGRAAGW